MIFKKGYREREKEREREKISNFPEACQPPPAGHYMILLKKREKKWITKITIFKDFLFNAVYFKETPKYRLWPIYDVSIITYGRHTSYLT